jgi:hypothetical protein
MIRVNICEGDEIWRKQISEIVSEYMNAALIAFKILNYTSIEECISQIEEVHQSRLIICDCNKEEPEHIVEAFDFRSKHEEPDNFCVTNKEKMDEALTLVETAANEAEILELLAIKYSIIKKKSILKKINFKLDGFIKEEKNMLEKCLYVFQNCVNMPLPQ